MFSLSGHVLKRFFTLTVDLKEPKINSAPFGRITSLGALE